jgi:hypothetical protein
MKGGIIVMKGIIIGIRTYSIVWKCYTKGELDEEKEKLTHGE